jgi:hypothetical protein
MEILLIYILCLQRYIICDDDDSINLVSNDSTLIIDSGASYHVSPMRDFFSSYTIGDFGMVKMRNKLVCEIVGTRDVILIYQTKLMISNLTCYKLAYLYEFVYHVQIYTY